MANRDLAAQAVRVTRLLERMARWKRPATGYRIDRYLKVMQARFERTSGRWADADEPERKKVLAHLADAHRRFPRPPTYPSSTGFVRFLADVARSEVSDELVLDALETMRDYVSRDLQKVVMHLNLLDVPMVRMLERVREAARAAGRRTLALEANEFLVEGHGDHWLAAAAAKIELLAQIGRADGARKFGDEAVSLLEAQGKYEDSETLRKVLQRALEKPRREQATTASHPDPDTVARRQRCLELSQQAIVHSSQFASQFWRC